MVGELTIEQFCDRHGACPNGREWAMERCQTMNDVWRTARADWLIWVATRNGVLTDRENRLFECFCELQNWQLPTDERSWNAVEVAERYADGQVTDEELSAARSEAELEQAEWLRQNTEPNFGGDV